MHLLVQVIDKYEPHIFFSLGVILVIMFILLLIILRKLVTSERRYRDFMRGTTRANLKEHLFQYSRAVKEVERKAKDLEYNQNELIKALRNCVQCVGLVRFNAYDDIGGELSFALAVLNGSGDGVVISAIYGRNDSRIYAKPVEKGSSTYPLSEEEEKAIEKAISGKYIL